VDGCCERPSVCLGGIGGERLVDSNCKRRVSMKLVSKMWIGIIFKRILLYLGLLFGNLLPFSCSFTPVVVIMI